MMHRIFLTTLALAGVAALVAALIAPASAAPAAPVRYTAFLRSVVVAPNTDPDFIAVAEAADDLAYPSATDAPLLPFVAPSKASASPLAVCQALAGTEAVYLLDPVAFLAAPARTAPWMTPEQLAVAARFATLSTVFFAHLADPVACQVGSVRAAVYLIGVSSHGTVGGFRTVVVIT